MLLQARKHRKNPRSMYCQKKYRINENEGINVLIDKKP
jgi:hypothetical protein